MAREFYQLGALTKVLIISRLNNPTERYFVLCSEALNSFGTTNISFFSQSSGPYTIIIGTPSKIEDVIQYADFTQKVSAVSLVDDTTLDEEPNLDDLYALIDGNIQLTNIDLHVLPASTFQ